jgi:hypothetical protein
MCGIESDAAANLPGPAVAELDRRRYKSLDLCAVQVRPLQGLPIR